MKCLEKDRDRQHESASALAQDIENYLNDEPVAACPPSRAYGLRKFVRRHRGAVLAASSMALLLVLGIIGTTIGELSVVSFCYLEWYRWQQQQEATGKDKPFWQRLRTAGLKERSASRCSGPSWKHSSALLPPMTGSSVSGACWIKWAAPLPLPQLEMDAPLPQLGATLPLPQPDGKDCPYFRSVLRRVSKRAA